MRAVLSLTYRLAVIASAWAVLVNTEHVVTRISSEMWAQGLTSTSSGELIYEEEAHTLLEGAVLSASVRAQLADADWTVTVYALEEYVSDRRSALPVVIVVLLAVVTATVGAGQLPSQGV